MAAGLLLLAVCLDTFLTGWLVAKHREMAKVIEQLANIQQINDHDISELMSRTDGLVSGGR